jgi:hypothetical protein
MYYYLSGGKMYPNQTIGKPHLGPEYVPYFYASGRFVSYDLPRAGAPLEAGFVPTGSYDFTSDLIQRRVYPAGQTVDQVIRRGYLAIPKSDPETAIISDKKSTSRLGLDDVIVLEEAHNLLLKKSNESKESVLETSIRMVRQYGLGYVFVDQSASLLSKVAFANSYATIALSQKLRSDVQAISAAMNLTDEQKQALNTLPIGTAVVRLADEHPEPFLVKIPLFPIREGCVSDSAIRAKWGGNYTDTSSNRTAQSNSTAVSVVPAGDKKKGNNRNNLGYNDNSTRPPSPRESKEKKSSSSDSVPKPPRKKMSRDEIRFLADVVARPLSTTVSRYQRLNLSRRRGNAVREALASAGIIERVVIATRSGQVVLYQLADFGRTICNSHHIDPGPRPRESLEHRFWVNRTARHFEKKSYAVKCEHPVKGNGAIDIMAKKPGEQVAIEIETGKSNIAENLDKIKSAGFDRVVLVATSPTAVSTCQKVVDAVERGRAPAVELITWLDV